MMRLVKIGLMMWVLVAANLSAGCGSDESDVAAGSPAPCGTATCSPTEYCCDAACGLCVPNEVACTETCP